ncbi:MAG TPA: protein kinase [Planctomycetota bacterium]|nr:protein kinase [Planctomycetota bacterium]
MAAESGFGEFVIESVLGEGGMGKVYRARQVSLDRWVALKVLPRAKENPNFAERFYREARSAARLVHPNIIQIYTVGEYQSIPYFAMEYIEGEDLENILRPSSESVLTVDEIVEIIRAVAKALAVAMEHGIVHRDIKPANIMITRTGLVKVMDFGLAKGVTNDAVTQAGLVVGTPAYMSPEQGASKPVDTRSDIYSLGCVMYNCIGGKAPFSAENVASLLYKHMYEPPEPLKELRPDLNPELESICMKMLGKKAEDRYQTPQELLLALTKVPANSAAAELSLAQRASKAFSARKAVAKSIPISGSLPKPASGEHPGAQRPNSGLRPMPPTVGGMMGGTIATAGPGSGIRLAPPPPPSAEPGSSSKITMPRPLASDPPSRGLTPRPPPPPAAPQEFGSSSKFVMPRPPQPPRPASGEFSSSGKIVMPRAPDPLARPVSKIGDTFVKLADGRWSYSVELGRCNQAYGLAAELTLKPGEKPQGLGDCLLCGNWNKRVGCAVAAARELENGKRYTGLKLLVEQSILYAGAGRFDKAIALLEDFVKSNPDTPEAYRELARLYERPEYPGKDRRRAIVLYRRFVELARTAGNYANVDISRAEERITALMNAPAESKSSVLAPGAGVASQCFYRGCVTCFSYTILTGDRMVVTRAGEVDPETGIHSSEMAGAMGRATTIFRRLKSEHAKKEEQARVKKELQRLSDIPLEDLPKDGTCVAHILLNQVTDVSMSIDTAVNVRCLSLKAAQQTHQLLFTEGAAFKAEQCHELLKRKLKAAS